jgi:uncharacterized protein YoxC
MMFSRRRRPSIRSMQRMTAARRASGLVIPVVAIVVLAAGCGGKSAQKSGNEPPADWVNNLCSSLVTWSTSVRTTTSSLKGNVTQSSLESTADEVTKATDKLESDLKGLGTPDTESGKKAKDTVDKLAGQLKTDVATIDKAVKEASGASGALKAVSTVSSSLVSVGDQVTTAFASIQQLDTKGELEKAFKNSEECKKLAKQGS